MKQRMAAIIIPVLLALVLGALNLMTPLASADQQAPAVEVSAPEAPAPQVQNNAGWAIDNMAVTSYYPTGFQFTLNATSTGGEIVSARVEWVHRANRPNTSRYVRFLNAEIDPNTGAITAMWEATQSDAVPPWVEIQYTWTLRDAAGNEFVTDTAYAEYEDHSRDWVRTESDDVIVFSTGMDTGIGEIVLDAMAEQRQKYIDGWGGILPFRPRVILFPDFDSFNEWRIYTMDTSGFGFINVGVTTQVWGGTAQALYSTGEDLAYGIVLHEVEHLYQAEFLEKRISFTPGWFTEGDAEYYRLDNVGGPAFNYANQRARADDLPALLHGHGPSIGGDYALEGYYLGYTFFAWIDEQWGIDMHRKIMNLLAEDLPFLEALEMAMGMSADEIETAWRVWLGASPVAPTLIPTWTPLPFLSSPTPFQFN